MKKCLKNIFSIHNKSLGMLWLLFASSALLLSGVLALVITLAKVPGIKELVQDLDWIRWCLTIHVNLATLVWFTAIPAGLVNFLAFHNAPKNSVARPIQVLGFLISILGVLLFISAWPSPQREVLMANYVPVVLHWQFFIGIGLYALGVAMNYFSLRVLKPEHKGAYLEVPGLSESGFGLWVGVVFYFAALITTAVGYFELEGAQAAFTLEYFEALMWGGGHLMQHSTSVFGLIAWVLILSAILGQPIFSREQLFKYFAYLGLSLFIVPVLLMLSLHEEEYRRGFTQLMQWGIAPVFVVFFIAAFKKLKGHPSFQLSDYRVIALLNSSLLMLLGFIYGACIRGTDLRIPGHYHAVIGAVTIVFMALVYHILSSGREPSRWIYRAMCTFGVGQVLFASGMFWAGVQGVGRKTYGSEHAVKTLGQYFSFGSMAVGGILAFTAGVFFAIAIWPRLSYYFKAGVSKTA